MKSWSTCGFIAEIVGLAFLGNVISDVYSQGQEKDNTNVTVQEDDNATEDGAQENEDSSCKEEVSSPTVFVNTRRGKGNCTKRKLSDTAPVTECNAKLSPSTVEVLHIITH